MNCTDKNINFIYIFNAKSFYGNTKQKLYNLY